MAFLCLSGFYHRTSCESNRCEPAVEPRQVFSACSVPPDAGDSGKLPASPPSAAVPGGSGRTRESTTGTTWGALDGHGGAVLSCGAGAGEHGVLGMPSSWQGDHRIALPDEVQGHDFTQ